MRDFTMANTGDWIIMANGDYGMADDDQVILNRIATRLKIPRGSFIYDTDDSLGSELFVAQRYSMTRALREIPAFIREALNPMEDIQIDDIDVIPSDTDLGQVVVKITYLHSPINEAAEFQNASQTFITTFSL